MMVMVLVIASGGDGVGDGVGDGMVMVLVTGW